MNSTSENNSFNLSLKPNALTPSNSFLNWFKDKPFFIQSPDLNAIIHLFTTDLISELPKKLAVAVGEVLIEVAKQDIQTYIENIKKVNEGQALVDMEEYQEAINVFKEVIRKQPSHYKAWFTRSLCLLLLGELDQALTSFEQTIARKETFEAYYYKSVTQVLLQNFDAALASITQAIQLNPDSSELWFDKARIFEQLKHYTEAVDAYDEAIALKPNNYSAHVNRELVNGTLQENFDKLIGRGSAFIKKSRYEEGLACLNKVIEINPESVEAWSLRAEALSRSRAYQDAVYSYQKVIELNLQLASAYYGMGISFYRLRKYKSAYTTLKKSIELNDEFSKTWLYLGMAAYQLGYSRKAIHAYSEFCKSNPDSIIGLLYKGHTFRKKGDYKSALNTYNFILKKSPGNLEVLMCLGKVYLALGSTEEALAIYSKLAKTDHQKEHVSAIVQQLSQEIEHQKEIVRQCEIEHLEMKKLERERQKLDNLKQEGLKQEKLERQNQQVLSEKPSKLNQPQKRKWFGLF